MCRRLREPIGLLLCTGLALFFFRGSLAAQALTGQISGTVQDPSGKVVPNAQIELINIGTSQKREAMTDSAGDFLFT